MRKIKFIKGRYYHILNRGNEKKLIFFERENYLFFLQRLKTNLDKFQVKLICYCLLPNHFHLILKECSENDISGLMMSLQISYAKAINKRYERSGHLFQGPFKNIHIDKDTYLLHLSRYIHINPVDAGLVNQLEDWEYSSYREFVGLRNGKLPQTEAILSLFSNREEYRQFVMDYQDENKIRRFTLE